MVLGIITLYARISITTNLWAWGWNQTIIIQGWLIKDNCWKAVGGYRIIMLENKYAIEKKIGISRIQWHPNQENKIEMNVI